MERPKVGVGIFIMKENKFLIGMRLNSHGNKTWSLPGGHLKFSETFEDCAKREVLEETGLEIENVEFLTATNDIFMEEKKHYITIFVKAEHKCGEPQVLEPDKCLVWKWVDWTNMPEPLFLPIENLKKMNFDVSILKNKKKKENKNEMK